MSAVRFPLLQHKPSESPVSLYRNTHLHRRLFWGGFPSPRQILGTLLWEARWLRSSEGERESLQQPGWFSKLQRQERVRETCLISHFSRSVILVNLRSFVFSCISNTTASTGRSGFLIASSPAPYSGSRLRLGLRSSPVT